MQKGEFSVSHAGSGFRDADVLIKCLKKSSVSPIFGDEQDGFIRDWFCAMNDTGLVLTSFCYVLLREGVPLSVGTLSS